MRSERRANSLSLSVHADYPIRVYASEPVRVGAEEGGAAGIAIGALIGSIVPVAGTIIGGAIGGVVGSGAGAARGAIVSNSDCHTVYARDVFCRLPQFTNDNNVARCTIPVTG